jgi:hypothetical protein
MLVPRMYGKRLKVKLESIMRVIDMVAFCRLQIAFLETYANAEEYNLAEVLELHHVISPEELQKVKNITLTEVDVEPLIRRIHYSTPGYDVPAWLLDCVLVNLLALLLSLLNVPSRPA